jgi:hypothetical protein
MAARICASLEDMGKAGLVDGVDAICSRVTVVDDLRAAVGDMDYVQESVFERVEAKRAVSEAIGASIRDDAVVGSSSAGIPASAFTEHAPRRKRFLIAHPVNPPHLVPLVELVPAPWTDPAIVLWLRAAMRRSARPQSSSIGRSRGSSSIACRVPAGSGRFTSRSARGAGKGETSRTVGVAGQAADGPRCSSPLPTLGIAGRARPPRILQPLASRVALVAGGTGGIGGGVPG